MTVKLSDIRDAREILNGVIIPTPILADDNFPKKSARALSQSRMSAKKRLVQDRGAYTRFHRLSDDEKRRGVICASAGNHAQGVALAAQMHDIKRPSFCLSSRADEITATKITARK
jgi:threonine dehydratase